MRPRPADVRPIAKAHPLRPGSGSAPDRRTGCSVVGPADGAQVVLRRRCEGRGSERTDDPFDVETDGVHFVEAGLRSTLATICTPPAEAGRWRNDEGDPFGRDVCPARHPCRDIVGRQRARLQDRVRRSKHLQRNQAFRTVLFRRELWPAEDPIPSQRSPQGRSPSRRTERPCRTRRGDRSRPELRAMCRRRSSAT